MKMQYRDGTVVDAADFKGVMESIRRNYPGAVVYQDGWRIGDDDGVTMGGRILIWADKASSVNDDGRNVIAVIEDP